MTDTPARDGETRESTDTLTSPQSTDALTSAARDGETLSDEETAVAKTVYDNLTRQGDPYALTRTIEHMMRSRPAADISARLTADAERYRFLRDNPLGLRAVNGGANWPNRPATDFDYHVDAARAAAPTPGDEERTEGDGDV